MKISHILMDSVAVADINDAYARAGASSPFAQPTGLVAVSESMESRVPPLSPKDEAIVLLTGRPIVSVRNNTFSLPELGERWTKSLAEAKTRLEKVLPSIGRIEVRNHPSFSWLATGWVVDEGIIVTNRHVAREFAMRSGEEFVFRRNPRNKVIEPSIDFRQEHLIPTEDIFPVAKVLWIEEDDGADIAFLVLGASAAGAPARVPIPLATQVASRREVAVIGYPAEDGRRNDPEAEQKIFGDVFDVKRLAPGLITSVDETYFTHDCSTLGGNSGSAVIDLATGEALGLHFAGTYLEANYAVPAPVIAATLAKARAPRVTFATTAELVARNCKRKAYTPVEVPSFSITGELVAYASPDSTFAVTKRLFDAAQSSILIGIYDFTADYMSNLLKDAMKRGVKVELMLDLDHRTGEDAMFEDLVQAGCDGTSAPSCANANQAVRYFASSHEKVVVIDDEIVLVQSGNYSDASIPRNLTDGVMSDAYVPGNRDMGVMIRSTELAAFFTKILRGDIKLVKDAPEPELREAPRPPRPQPIFDDAPGDRPEKLFPSKRFDLAGTCVQPVLTPDNYMDVIPAALAQAKRSIYIEQQYVRGKQDQVARLLEAIQEARAANPALDVKIIVAPLWSAKELAAEATNMQLLESQYGLKLGTHIRLLSPERFAHCHNKLIVIDDERVLVSSQNWSNAAVSQNREAGLLIDEPGVAAYFSAIFASDWETGARHLVMKSHGQPGGEARVAATGVRVNPGDYDEV